MCSQNVGGRSLRKYICALAHKRLHPNMERAATTTTHRKNNSADQKPRSPNEFEQDIPDVEANDLNSSAFSTADSKTVVGSWLSAQAPTCIHGLLATTAGGQTHLCETQPAVLQRNASKISHSP